MRLVFLILICFSTSVLAANVSDISSTVKEGAMKPVDKVSDWYVYATTEPLFKVGDTEVMLMDLAWATAVFVISIILSALIRRFLNRLPRKNPNVSASGMFTVGRLIQLVMVFVGLLIALSMLGIDFSKLALVIGALGVGIGIGLQSIFNNFVSGLILLFERPIKVGDLIELDVSGTRGRVRAINVRSTHVRTWDNIDVLVPNSEFVSGRVINYTLSDDTRRLHIPFGVAYGSDKELVKKAATEAALELPCTINHGEHKLDVWLVGFGDSSLNFELVVWVRTNQLPADKHPIGMYLWEIETKLAVYSIEIPFPQRDLHLRSVTDAARGALPSKEEQES